ncbi:MAG: methyltransferase family protein [bacterium]
MRVFILYLVSAIILLVAAVVIFRILFWRDYQQKGQLSPLSTLLGSLIWFCWGGFPMIYGPKDWPEVHVWAFFGFIGKVALWGGLAIVVLGIAQLGLVKAFGQQQSELKQTGFYRFSRNPQIVSCALYGIGFAILWPSLYALGWLLLFVPLAHIMVLVEEEHLRRKYGDAYWRYCERVPRYLGFRR